MSLEPGSRLANYEILEPIGAGGMGEVYRARDMKLGRLAAIKILPPALAEDPARVERFELEARAASALNHPNIVHIYEIGVHQGLHFIAMEHVEGRTLRKIVESGAIPAKRVLGYAKQLAEGLAKAHATGVVHRDLKPENVMVTPDGYVKILDFGLAKLFADVAASESEAPTLAQAGTTPGTVLGTVGYMSPEQARGFTADFRSDQFSLGAILYEMIAGRRAFDGDTAADRISAILRDEPELPSNTSPELRSVVSRCLSKEPAARYHSTRELADELSETTEGSTKSIAVVPLRNLSTEKDTEYFSDGLSEDIILDLSQVADLRVISRSSAMRLKGTEKDLETIGAELHVDYVLEGSVRRSGDDVRITVQLVDVSKDAHVWGDRFSGSLENVFAFQEEISRKIVEALKLTLSPEEERRISERPIDDVQAYDTYLKARQDLWRFTAEGLERAQRLLQNALDRVGDNALLYAALGVVEWQYVNCGLRSPESGLKMAKEYCERAFALRPDSPDGQFLRGLLAASNGDSVRAIRQLKQCLAAQPSHSDALFWICLLYLFAGKTAVAQPYIRTLLELDPLTPQNRLLPGWSQVMDGHLEEAIDAGLEWSELDPANPILGWVCASLLARLGRRDEALSALADIRTLAPDSVFDGLSRFFEAVLREDREGAVASIVPYAEKAWWDLQYSWEVASGYAVLGDTEEALRWLRNAVDRDFVNYPFLNEHDPFLENLRGEKAFQELMKHVRERWESFDA